MAKAGKGDSGRRAGALAPSELSRRRSALAAPVLHGLLREIGESDLAPLQGKDFLLTWDKPVESLRVIMAIARVLRALREGGFSARIWDSGLAISQFRDTSTRTRFSFASACNLLGLAVQELDEGKSQLSHGETVRETSVMVSFMADAIGIRDDLYLGRGHAYMLEVAQAVEQAASDGVLGQRPPVINLQCDLDHPTQTLADLLHVADHFGGLQELRGKRLAMSWAYSPSYGKPLSVPQGVIALFVRFGMHVTLAHPPGYCLLPDVVDKARELASSSHGSLSITDSMEKAFEGAQLVYPKSWAPLEVMEERAKLAEGAKQRSREGELEALEKRCLTSNARFADWECTDALMARTDNALYLHCLPADITGVSCAEGEVSADVFTRFRAPLYRQAGWKPYVIAAMILASRTDPVAALEKMILKAPPRMR